MKEEYRLPAEKGATAAKLTEGEKDAIECLVREVWAATWTSANEYSNGNEAKEEEANGRVLAAFAKFRDMGFFIA